MAGIDKAFGSVRANAGVDLSVAAGSIHGLVGENGAGKSTLMSILYGLVEPDGGSIEVAGRPVRIRRPDDAIALGLGMVHQHFMLVDTLSALDNVLIGAEPHLLLGRARAAVRTSLDALMAATGLHVDLDALVETLSVGDRQRLDILKALHRGARVLVLDEPTAVLTPQETGTLFDVLARLREDGRTIVLITHKLKEVMRLCDRVTVMRDGRVVLDCATGETSVGALAEAMVGRHIDVGRHVDGGRRVHIDGQIDHGLANGLGRRDTTQQASDDVPLRAEGLVVRDAMRVTRLHGVSIALRAGEIVGVAGVAGNGQSELLEVLAGLRAPDAGTLSLGAERFAPGRWLDPRTARRLGLAHVPEDRQARALVMGFAAWESAVLGYDDLPAYSRGGWMRRRRMQDATATLMDRFDVRPRDIHLGSLRFSGGNQQKLVLARELGQQPRVLLVGQPTRGVDVGAIAFIHARLRAMRDAGCSLLLVSSELDEILALADRVLVMNAGRIAGELPIAECDESRIGVLMGTTVDAASETESA